MAESKAVKSMVKNVHAPPEGVNLGVGDWVKYRNSRSFEHGMIIKLGKAQSGRDVMYYAVLWTLPRKNAGNDSDPVLTLLEYPADDLVLLSKAFPADTLS